MNAKYLSGPTVYIDTYKGVFSELHAAGYGKCNIGEFTPDIPYAQSGTGAMALFDIGARLELAFDNKPSGHWRPAAEFRKGQRSLDNLQNDKEFANSLNKAMVVPCDSMPTMAIFEKSTGRGVIDGKAASFTDFLELGKVRK